MKQGDRAILLNSNSWLNDNLINAGQELLSSQFPHIAGFQSVTLGHTLAFEIQKGEFIQVIHSGGNHWVTISTVGCNVGEINVYDSLPPSFDRDVQSQI